MSDFTVILPLPGAIWSGHFRDVYTNDDGSKYEHPGGDLIYATPAQTLGAPIVAPADMKLTLHRPGDGWGDGSFGVCAIGDHPDTPFWSVCAHMQADRLPFNTGDFVRQGQTIGYVGMTGKTTGPHCHWGMSKSDGGQFSPSRILDAASGIWRIGNPLLLDPESFLAAGAPTTPTAPYVPTLPDVAASLANLSNIVGDERLKADADRLKAEEDRARIIRIETALTALVTALQKT